MTHAKKIIYGYSIVNDEYAQLSAQEFNIIPLVFPSGKSVLLLDLYMIPVDFNISSFLELLEKEGVIYRNIQDIKQ